MSLVGALTIIARGDLAVLLALRLNGGDALILVAVLSYAAYSTLLRRRPPIHPLSFLTVTFIMGALILLPFYLWEHLSGQRMPLDVTTVLAVGYVAVSMLGVAAFGLFFSTLTDSPLGATMGALAVLVASSLLFTLDAASPIAPYLPTRHWLAFVDFFRDPILWRDITRGIALQGVYVGVLLAAAWANFTTKDVTS